MFLWTGTVDLGWMNMYNFDANWRIANLDETKAKLCSPQLCLRQLVGAGRVAVGTLRCDPQGLDHAWKYSAAYIYLEKTILFMGSASICMGYVLCSMYDVRCKMYYVLCKMHGVLCIFCVLCILYYVLCTALL